MQYKNIIDTVYPLIKELEPCGEVAQYIPELANIDPAKFGVHLCTNDGFSYGVGDHQEKFSIQSIAKVLSVSLAYKLCGEPIWERLDVEPSGTGFNSLVQLEADKGIPRNPFINAGAIVICDILLSKLDNTKDQFLDFVRSLSGNHSLNYCDRIANSEKLTGYRNVALCNFIKSFGNIENEPEAVLDFYYDLCSLEMSCQELSQLFLFLTNKGRTIEDDIEILTHSQTKRINALMLTCGFYDESGEFAFEVGLPGKSGVGGGTIVVHPHKYTVAVWSPRLNLKGNSYKGMKFLEAFTSMSQSSIF